MTALRDRLAANLEETAKQIAASGSTWQAQSPVLQFVIRDKGVRAFVGLEEGRPGRLVYGRHAKPNLAVYMTEADLESVAAMGGVRDYVTVHGDKDLVTAFRSLFMSLSADGRQRIEAAAAAGPPLTDIDYVDATSLTAEEFVESYAAASRPAVLLNAMPHWRSAGWTPESLKATFGELTVQVRSGKVYSESMQSEMVRLREYINRCMSSDTPDSDSCPPYAASNVVPLNWSAWLDYPPFVDKRICSFAKYWIGPAGTLTPLHRDWLDNFLTQHIGTKQLALISPRHASLLRPQAVHQDLDSCNWIDPYETADPIVVKCSPRYVTLRAGEMLFLPAGWFHDVRATTFSFSVNFFLQRIPYAAFGAGAP
jgi:hypothetical protein